MCEKVIPKRFPTANARSFLRSKAVGIDTRMSGQVSLLDGTRTSRCLHGTALRDTILS
jgi:hypothetical protein